MIFHNGIPDKIGDIASSGLALGIGNFETGEIDVFTNYPSEWQSDYERNGWVTSDPVVRTGLHTNGSAVWEVSDNLKMAEPARDLKLDKGVLVSSYISGSRCIAGVPCQTEFSPATQETLERNVRELHMHHLTKKACQLSDTQKNLVFFFASGMGTKEIADLYEISDDAIKQRKLSIKKAIGVRSFMAAINVCAIAGLTLHPIN